jgi:hypothetical protein
MKLRVSGSVGLFDALLVDGPDCQDLGHAAALCITWVDGDKVFAAREVAAQRCQVVWATPGERRLLTAYGFLKDPAQGH